MQGETAMEKTISDLVKSQPMFEAGWYYGKAQPSGAVEFSQKELQWMKLHYKKMINEIDANVQQYFVRVDRAGRNPDKHLVKNFKAYRKFLSEIQRKVKKALNNGSW